MLGFASAGFWRLRLVLWLFPSCVWDALWYRILIKKTLFLEQNRNFPKRRWVRSRNVFLSPGGLVASVVTRKTLLRTSSDLFTWNNTWFLFKCRVTFRLRQTSKATFGTLALYILRLRCFVLSNPYKNSFCFLSKKETFQNDVEYDPKMFFWALLGLFLWWYLKSLFWELPEISLLETIRDFCSNAESRLGCAGCRKLRLIMGFKSCLWDIQYQLLKKQFFFFWNISLRRSALCTLHLEGFCTNLWKMSANVTKTS